jgi:transposase-like protein
MWSNWHLQRGCSMTTRAPLTEAEKQYIYDRKQQGASLNRIAQELECSPQTARKWWRYRRDGDTPRARGRPRTGILSTYPEKVRQRAVEFKQAHPHWGPAMVKLEMIRQLGFCAAELPCDERLSALFKEACPEAIQPRQRRHYPEKAPPKARRPHECWQIDEKEAVRVGDQRRANILNVRDPVAALLIASRAFETTTEKGWRKLTRQEVQETLRDAFQKWGLPLKIQTDHGKKYVGNSQASFPSLFTLWLVGLRIEHTLSRSRRPTDQPHVERSHRTVGDMAWKDQPCASVEQLQALLDQCCQRYNREYPSHAGGCKGQPPLDVHPWAEHSGRPFHPDAEWELFDMQRVDAYLAHFVWTRTVSRNGEVHIGRHRYQVGGKHAGQTVSVRFVPEQRAFCFQASDGSWSVDHLALELDQADIIGRMPLEQVAPLFFQLPLPIEGV